MKPRPDISFKAILTCVTPGWEGYLDYRTLDYGGGKQWYKLHAISTYWLTVHNAQPYRNEFFFLASEDEKTGRISYEIITEYKRRQGGEIMVCMVWGQDFNDYVEFTRFGVDSKKSLTRHWELMSFPEVGAMAPASVNGPGIYKDLTLMTGRGRFLRVYKREIVGAYWHGYVYEHPGVPDLKFDLEVLEMQPQG